MFDVNNIEPMREIARTNFFWVSESGCTSRRARGKACKQAGGKGDILAPAHYPLVGE